jgi:hypothetical protein
VLEAAFILLEFPSPSRRIFIGSHSLPLSGSPYRSFTSSRPRWQLRVAAVAGASSPAPLPVLAAVMAWGSRGGCRGGAPSCPCRQRWLGRTAVVEHSRTRAGNGGRGELPRARSCARAAGGGLGELPRACTRGGGQGRSSLASAPRSRRGRSGAPLHPRRCSRPRQKCLMKCQRGGGGGKPTEYRLQGALYPSV